MEESLSFPHSAKAARDKPHSENQSETIVHIMLRQRGLKAYCNVFRLIHSTNVKRGAT